MLNRERPESQPFDEHVTDGVDDRRRKPGRAKTHGRIAAQRLAEDVS